jgi:YjbE family integral membrane protein
LINLLLSGDNAVIIAMACRGLPPRQRLWGMIIGASGAVLLRVVFTVLFARLMVLPYVNLIGGLALLYIAAKLLVPADRGKEQIKAAANLWRAVRTVAVADVIMSLDNTIAIVVAARGNLALLVIGLVLSIPIILAGAALIMALLDRFPIFVWAGAALLGWIAGDIIATDPAVSGYLTAELGEKVAQQMQIASAAAGAVLVIAMGGFLRRRGKSKSRTKAAK